jgi:class 3 adenylate cyclase/pimeloyl-ACP methyl ester carboxylesterase
MARADSGVSFAQNGDINIAYRVLGDGEPDIMLVPTWASNIDLIEEHPTIAKSMDTLASSARLILFDRRGSGLSDRMSGAATLEEGMDDLVAVLDSVGSKRVALFGLNESGPLCALMAATHPERVSALILYGSFATTTWHPDYPWGQKVEEREAQIDLLCAFWGLPGTGAGLNGGQSDDERFVRWADRWLRGSITRDALRPIFEILGQTDVRRVLPSIRVPTLVLHRTDDPVVPVANGRYLAEAIPDAKYVELPGTDHIPFLGDFESVVDEIEEFLTGQRRTRIPDRILATILFTDIVGSTERALELGDRRWKELLDEHDDLVTDHIERFQGKAIKALGDGHLATFDGPARAIRCACSLRDAVGRLGLEMRAGVHTGEVEMRGSDVGGIAVHIGARVCDLANAGEVLVSGSVPPLVAGSGVDFDDRGTHQLKGIAGDWHLYAAR